MSFKTPFLVDRRVFDKKGKWKSPNNDLEENVFYFVKEPLTIVPSYEAGGREELKETITIVVFGSKPFCVYDNIELDDGTKYRIMGITYNDFSENILIKDMLKPRSVSTELVLE